MRRNDVPGTIYTIAAAAIGALLWIVLIAILSSCVEYYDFVDALEGAAEYDPDCVTRCDDGLVVRCDDGQAVYDCWDDDRVCCPTPGYPRVRCVSSCE